MLVEVRKYIGVESLIPTFGVFILAVYYFYYAAKRNYPRGPKGLPVLGCVTRLGSHPSNTLSALAKEYGNIFSVQIGMRNWVVLNDYESIRKALLEHGNAFSGRPDLHLLRQMGEGIGVIFADHGPHWKIQKKFEVVTLREFTKTRLEKYILQEVNFMSAEIEAHNGVGLDVQRLLTKAAGNVINQVVLSTRFPYDDAVYNKLIACLDRTFFKHDTAPIVLAMLVAPITRFLPKFRTLYEGFTEDVDTSFDVVGKLLEAHKKTYHDDEVRNFVDAFLKEMNRKRHDLSFMEKQVFQFIRELFVAGSANTGIMLLWCLLAFMKFPECQEKIAKEIETVIGGSGTPTMKHRDKMPYTCAFIQEIFRHRTLTPLGLPHKTTTDVSFQGYDIPAHTPILTNFWAVHHDKEHFEKPEEFRPERFLDEDGAYVADPQVIPFSFGPRTCSGELVVKTEMFMFLAAIVQRYKIKAKKPLPDFNDGVFGILYAPRQFDAIFETR